MLTFYLCFLAGGVVVPVISLMTGFLGDGVDTDVTTDVDMDVGTDISTDTIGGTALGLLPTSLMSISALAITFGTVGSIMSYTGRGRVLTFIISLVAGYLASVLVQTIIKSLKKIQTRYYGINENELLLYDGKVIDTILPGQLGTVSFSTLKNVSVSYPARCNDASLKLVTGKIVKPVELKDGIVIVEPKNKYE